MSATRKGLSCSAAKRLGFGTANATAPAPVVFKKLRRVICDRHTTFQGSRQLHRGAHQSNAERPRKKFHDCAAQKRSLPIVECLDAVPFGSQANITNP